MRVRATGDKTHNASEFVLAAFYILTTNGCTTHFQRENHIVNCLDANALIGIDILHLQGLILNLSVEMAALTHNMVLKVKLNIVARGEKVERQIVTKAKTIVSPHLRRLVPFNGAKGTALDLPKRDVLFEQSNKAITKFTHLVNAETNVIMVENDIGAPVVLPKPTRIDSVVDIEIDGFFATPESNANLAATGQKKPWKYLPMKGLLAANAAWHVHNTTREELPTTRSCLRETSRPGSRLRKATTSQ